MKKILVPIDGSDNALRAVRHALAMPDVRLEILHVLDPMSLRSHANRNASEIQELFAREADQVLQPAREMLDRAGISYQASFRVGQVASEIAAQAHEAGCDGIVMGTRGMGPISTVLIGSVATRVVHLVDVPVTLIK